MTTRFGRLVANDDVSLDVARGEIHAIVGENGAGKSTLMRTLYGMNRPDVGTIELDGAPVTIRDPAAAIALGIGMVHQRFQLVDSLTALENLALGRAPSRHGVVFDRDAALTAGERLAAELGTTMPWHHLVRDLSVGDRQRLEIMRLLYRDADVLILDEPTSVLTPGEVDELFVVLCRLAASGRTILFVTHKLREIMAITDTVSVMRQGTMVATRETKNTTVEELAELMVGRRVLLRVEKGEAKRGAVKLAVNDLTVKDGRGVTMVDRVSFELRAGEIVGIAGVAGNGQSELIEAICGIRRAVTGTVMLGGEPIDLTGAADPGELRDRGLAHVPEDRHHVGLVLAFEENENSILGYHDDERYAKGMFLDIDAIRDDAREKIEKYDIRPADCRLKTANFSGGNQQKIVLAREMEQDPGVLIVGQPTRGVDVGAIEFIHKRLIAMRDAGKAVLLVSVELDEIRSLSDRILVMFEGRIVGERGPEASEGELGLLMAGVEHRQAAE
jgi:simple sugar transport system ATP-binding protein